MNTHKQNSTKSVSGTDEAHLAMYVIDLFCGAGGFSAGAHMAGASVIACVDNWAPGLSIHQKNFPNAKHVLMDLGGNVEEFVGQLQQFISDNVPPGSPWHLHGSPPCQSFSKAQRQDKEHDVEKDARSNLTLWFIDVVTRLKPERWSMEQVPGCLKYIEKHRPEFLKTATIYPKVYGYQFGAPTLRKRLYMGGGWTFPQGLTQGGSEKKFTKRKITACTQDVLPLGNEYNLPGTVYVVWISPATLSLHRTRCLSTRE
jgi:site-specific DNA-cytosine methylase